MMLDHDVLDSRVVTDARREFTKPSTCLTRGFSILYMFCLLDLHFDIDNSVFIAQPDRN